ncbi:MAG: TspO/MBR family protein [Sphingopyxis sp.]
MNEIASTGQLRMSYLRWALLCVPAIVALGSLMGKLSNSGYGNRWFNALVPADVSPPGWVFAVVWTALYIMLGLALAMVLNARRARGRGAAIAAFVVQLIANLAWSPLFFALHQVSAALVLIICLWVAAVGTTILFGRVRAAAAWLMVPYLCWLSFAAILNFQIDQRNPDAETLVPPAASANISIGQGN